MMTQKRKWRQILQLKDTPVTNMLFLVFAGVSMLMNKVPPPVCVCLTGVLVSQRVCVCVCVLMLFSSFVSVCEVSKLRLFLEAV